MHRLRLSGLALLTLVTGALAPIASAQAPLDLRPVGTYATGRYDQSAAEIVDYDPALRRAFFVNAQARQVQAVDLTNPAVPVLAFTLDVAPGAPNSVAIFGSLVAVAVEASLATAPGEVRFYTTQGDFVRAIPVGSLPDALAFDATGRYVVVANEGEPSGGVDPEGTISVIDLANGVASATVRTVRFTDFNAGGPRRGELNASVLLDASAASTAQDLEPEFVSIAGGVAYVSVQEANAVAVVDLATGALRGVYGLGFKDHNAPGNGFDASDNGSINIRNWPVLGAYQPDGVATFEDGGVTYVVTANEGDARTDARLATRILDPTAFPDRATLQLPANLGRLNIIPTAGDTDGDGDFDRIVSFGARSFSVFRVGPGGLTLAFDSGDQFERTTAARFPANFNASNSNNTLDNRSDDKGPEPEGITTGIVNGRRYAFVGLERIGGVMVYDLTNPAAPTFVTYANNRNFAAATNTAAAGDLGPEGVKFLPGNQSPTSRPLLLLSNETSGTVTAFNIGANFTLTLLHNNDGESKLLPATVAGFGEVGGVARFVSVVDRLRAEGEATTDGVVVVSSGDNVLPGPEFTASLNRGRPFYDAIALDAVGYSALAIGNHEFDFGPDVFADFINSFTAPPPFVSANLDVSAEPSLAALAARGIVVRRAVVQAAGRRVGIVGATTPLLRALSSPRNVVVIQDVAGAVQSQVDALTAEGVDVIILISQLQQIAQDRALIPMLRGVDIAVAGGGNELLANAGDPLIPTATGTFPTPVGAYPLRVADAAGRDVLVVTTAGDYLYVGRLVAEFDPAGNVVGVRAGSGPVRVVGAGPDATAPDPDIQRRVVEPVRAAVAALATRIVGRTDVRLDGTRPPVRIRETNLGNLLADALLVRADALNERFGAPNPDVALQNGGGIRNSNVLPVGPLSELNTFQIAAFTNFLSIVPAVPAAQFKEILEQAYAGLPDQNGSFAQIAGFRVVLDAAGQAQTVDMAGNVTRAGRKVRQVVLDDGRVLVRDGAVVAGAPALNVATNDFSARGGDAYPFRGLPFTTLGVTYQQALRAYIESLPGGVVTAADYPEAGEGRITIGTTTDAEDDAAEAPQAFALAGLFPNPAQGQLSLRVDLADASDVRVSVVDVLGREVAATSAALGAGRHTVPLDLARVAAGAYVVRVTAEAGGQTQAAAGRITVVR